MSMKLTNPLPAPGNLRFQNRECDLLPWGPKAVARIIPSINFRFQGLTCGFFECILENRATTAPHVGGRLIRPRRAVRTTDGTTGPFSAFVAAVPNMRKTDVAAPSPRAHDGTKRIGVVGTIILATQVLIIGL